MQVGGKEQRRRGGRRRTSYEAISVILRGWRILPVAGQKFKRRGFLALSGWA